MMENTDDYVLQVSNLSVKLQNQLILDNVSFKLKKGIVLAIVGPNGAGKTVLLKALLGLVPHTGKVVWTRSVRIGYVPQNIEVDDIPISVKDFLSFEDAVDLESSLSPVKLEHASVAGKTLGVLSGGQLRRVLIAWALADKPNVLLFDEPTTGVDHDTEEPFFVMLNELKRKNMITVLLITHDVHIVREYSDYFLALNKCVTYFGESKDIMKPEVQRIIYGETVCLGTPNETR
jgi:zinc transport system ATP-binding protein